MAQPQDQRDGQNPATSANSEITADLVKQVAERVFEMWKRDLRIERERSMLKANRFHRTGGS